MQPCPAPDGSRLPAHHRMFLARLLAQLGEHGFEPGRLRPLVPGFVDELDALAPTDDELWAWGDELALWLRWHRVPAYWLCFVFQTFTQARGKLQHLLACDLYASAQMLFADDLALSSLETAYLGHVRNAEALGPAFDGVRVAIEQRLRVYMDYLAQWTQPFDFHEANPIADHLYSPLSRSWLAWAANEGGRAPDLGNAGALQDLIERADAGGHAWHAVLARRCLALVHAAHGRHDDSLQPLQRALDDARRIGLDTEIGHLRRLLGAALRAVGRLDEARQQFEQALAFERQAPNFAYTAYWQALSARELGDTLLRLAGQSAQAPAGAAVDHTLTDLDPAKLEPALRAYRNGRMHFGAHMGVQCPFPLARAAKQQLFRSFSTNAVQVAAWLQQPLDVLAEVEWAGPREATELVAEMAAARTAGTGEAEAFRRSRARYFETLNTVPPRFEDYLAHIAEHAAERRDYLQRSIALDSDRQALQLSDDLVARAAALRLPDTIFLLFHLGPQAGTMVLMDMGSGLAAPFALDFGEQRLRALHAEFERRRQAAADLQAQNAALRGLLAQYEALLGPVLEPMLRFFPGRHLKIFPRLQMNAVPLHAMQLHGRTLLEHCATVSYGQTLGLFLANHGAPAAPCNARLRFVSGRDVGWYELLPPGLRRVYGSTLQEERQVRWPDLLASTAARPARDTVFACHGSFDPQAVARSELELGSPGPAGRVSFAEVFAQLDLQGCRSVVMGSCESGMSRTEVAAEYLGLPAAMLACGVRYVVGALWTIPALATAVLVDRFLHAVQDDDAAVCAALSQVQREVMRMGRDELAAWVRQALAGDPRLQDTLHNIEALPERPFAEPVHWAGLQAVGDV